MRDTDGPGAGLIWTYRILAAIALGLGLAIAAGTVVGLAAGKRSAAERPGAASGAAAPSPVPAVPEGPGTGYFTGIGRIRAASAGASPAAVVVSIAFPFDRGDGAFSEELAAKTKAFREIAISYFGTFSAAELRSANEAALKAELIKRFNRELRLGKIEELFFSEYLVID